MKPRFSVIVPLYNKAPYVWKALESIYAQTYKDFECIVVDDGSTDGSLDVVRDFIPNDRMSRANALNEPLTLNDNRFKIKSQANAGVAAARNNGIAKSRGEYVCFLDADDWWEPKMLEEMDKLIKEYPDAGIYCSNYVYYKPGKTHVALNLPRGYMNYPEAYLQGSMPVWTGAACLPRKVFDEMGGFPKGIKLGEDFLLWAKTALHYPVAFCEKPLAYYNNSVPANLRATRNMHAPEHNMFFLLDKIESIVDSRLSIVDCREQWKALLDWQRVNGLFEYWLSAEYHDVAAEELKKVDWSKQPKSVKARYSKPIWLLKTKRQFIQVGSYCKQKLIKMFNE